MVTYYTQDNHLDSDWMDQKARDAALSFFDSSNAIKSTQLRKFYADVKTLERRWEAEGGKDSAFADILPMLKLLKAKSEYALKRNVVPLNFRNWLWEHVDSIKAPADFKAFLLHFEAVVGFSYGYAREKRVNGFA